MILDALAVALFALALGVLFVISQALKFVLWLISVIIAIPTTNNDSLNP